MRSCLRPVGLRTLLALLLIAQSAAAQRQPAVGARLDGDGDELPAGAVLRLGTKRWRHGDEATSLVWTPDGKQLAFISEDSVYVMDGETGRKLRRFQPRLPAGAPLRPVGLAISPDGHELAVRSGGLVATFEWATAKHRRTYESRIEDFGEDGGNVCYSPDGKWLAFAEGPAYRVLDRQTGTAIVKDDTKSEIQGIAFTSDGTRLVVASLKPSLRVWDLAKREIAARWTFSDNSFVWGPGVSPDGKLVAVGVQHVEVVDPVAGEVKAKLHGDEANDLFLQLQFSPDGQQLLAASQAGAVYVWNTADWSRRHKLKADGWVTRSMALRPDGKRVAVGDARNRIWVWSLETGELLFNDRPGHNTDIQAVAFAPDGQTLATGGGARGTLLWSVRTGEHLRNLQTSSSTLAFTSDGKRLWSSWHGAPQLRTWDVGTGTQIAEWTAPEPRLTKFAVAADQTRIALLCEIDKPRGYRLLGRTFPELEAIRDVRQDGYTLGLLALTADGSLAALAPNEAVHVWSLTEARLVLELQNPGHHCKTLLFSRDDRLVMGTSSDRSVRVWELATGKLVRAMSGHSRVPGAMAMSPGGRFVATAGGADGFEAGMEPPQHIRLWDIALGEQVAALSGHNENVSALAFSPDGKLLAAGMRDTTTLVWNVPAAAQETRARLRPLTAAEAEALWRDLAADDARQGQAALHRLSLDPDRALAIAGREVPPARVPAEADLARLIAGLDAEEFKDRTAAYERLAGLGSAIAPQLRAAIAQSPSAEIKLRCGQLVERAQQRYPQAGGRLIETRAVQLLEQMDNEKAQALLATWAGGAAEAHLTTEAKAALLRLTKLRGVARP